MNSYPNRHCGNDGRSLGYPLTIVRGFTAVVSLDADECTNSGTIAPSQPRPPKILAAGKETYAMSAERVSIAQVMMVVQL